MPEKESEWHSEPDTLERMGTDTLPEAPHLANKLAQADSLKSRIDELQIKRTEILGTLYQKQRIDWTYHSNAIEGSTLTHGETAFFLQEGRTVEGKPFQDFLDARNHANTIDFLYQDILKNKRTVTPGLIKEINASLLHGVTHTIAMNQFGEKVHKPATPGEYKTNPNHVLRPDGTIHYYVDPLQVTNEIENLCNWIESESGSLHPVIVATLSHYNFVRIHPFDDGNGREARILMNLILLRKGYSPAIIKNEERRMYIQALEAANKGNLAPFAEFVAQSLIQTQNSILVDLTQNS